MCDVKFHQLSLDSMDAVALARDALLAFIFGGAAEVPKTHDVASGGGWVGCWVVVVVVVGTWCQLLCQTEYVVNQTVLTFIEQTMTDIVLIRSMSPNSQCNVNLLNENKI